MAQCQTGDTHTETAPPPHQARKTVNLKLPGQMNHGFQAETFPMVSGSDAQVSNDQI